MTFRLTILCLALANSQAAFAQVDRVAAANDVYQKCFDKAATELFASGVVQAPQLMKATRKRCKAERSGAVDAIQINIMLMGNPTRASRSGIAEAVDYRIARPVMKRLGFKEY